MLELDHANAISDRDAPRRGGGRGAAADRARTAGDATGELLARVGAGYYRLLFEADPAVDEVEQLAREVLPLLEQADDHAAWPSLVVLGVGVANFCSRFEDWAYAAEQALRHARLAGGSTLGTSRPRRRARLRSPPGGRSTEHPRRPAPENPHPWPLLCRAWLLTMLGRFEEAASRGKTQRRRLLDLTGNDAGDAVLGQIAATAGRYEDAALHLRRYCDIARPAAYADFSRSSRRLGRCLCFLGATTRPNRSPGSGCELGDEHDLARRALAAGPGAGRSPPRQRAAAERFAREAVAKNDARTD